ncbi:Inosine-uridine preferring nucleoside hydrolase [Musa troglodytarum]|uniref:Inosine-uridine preferring nucleoside hydrolase n=1 Tax=Musa troglodytarum TaxID=320322 RepID=A0A9E7EX84_9LILI|nr:Inosine-uridine preferring nucleoside hydrolase [Musa troglodytarum]
MESNSANGSPASDSGNHACLDGSMKVIIVTDPGRDDSMTILMAFQLPEIEILGLTTIFGNVGTEDATRNALLLGEEPSIVDFIHGSDGLGNIFLPPPVGKKMDKNASEFLVEMVSQYPGDVTILALGPLTNLALAIKETPCFASKVKKIVILGGPSLPLEMSTPAEANIYGDPEAADIVFTCGADITVVGINITTQVKFTGIFLHDPVSFAALVRPDLFTFKKGVVRVETQERA